MPKWLADEKAKKKKETQKAATKTKSQSSSVTKQKTTTPKATKAASKSTFLGGGETVKRTEQKQATVKKQPSAKAQAVAQRAKATNTQRQVNRDANLNLKQTVAQTSRTRTSQAEPQRKAAQQQKMTAGVDAAKARTQTRAIGNAVKSSVKDSLSADNRAFAQRQKSGALTAEDNKRIAKASERRTEIAKNTGAVAKKAVKDTLTGYGKTMADVSEMTQSTDRATYGQAAKLGIDKDKDTAQWNKLETNRKKGFEQARQTRLDLQKKQDERQAEWDERTKNAKGLEKAWYGAVESGTGMLADTAVGAVTGTGQFGALASMGLRTYGTTRDQAEKEGATAKEDRLYSLAQAGKEVATELMFQGAGLAKAAYGKTGLSLADKSANILTRGLTGLKADAVGAGVRALGGTAEENIEELAGWMADPLIKELTYGKAVRNRMKENLRANIPQIGSDADAANVASYFSTPKFTDDLTKEYVKSGLSKDKASELAAEMRDYYVAYYSGDKEKLDALETDLAAKLSGQDKLSFKSWSMDELKDTFASTTLLTLATGIPGAVNTSVKGNQIFDSDEVKAVFGNDAVRKVADAVKNTSNKEMSLKAETMKDRLDSGKDLTGTQKFDLYQGYLEKVNETAKKAKASYGVAEKAREEQDLVPTMGVDMAGNTVYAKETQKEYNEKFASTELTVEAIKNYMESDNSISDDESRRANAVKKAVADLHVGGLTVGDVHEFAYGNELAREALKAEEGIDLNRYIVRDSNGNVDLAATNEATENALFEINAANAIRAAQAETEVYIDDTRGNIDKDLLTRFGNNGQAVWKEVNKDLDPRNLQEYLTTANAASYFYSAGRNTDMSVDEAIDRYADTFKTVDNTVLKRAFAAGARDRIIANTPGYGQTVEAGSNIKLKKTKPIITGQLIMDKDVVIPDSDQSAYLALAMSTNSNIHIVGSLKSSTGAEINGMSHGNDIYLNVNSAAEANLGYVFMHEMTHQIKQYAPNEYLALENLVRDKWFNKDATGMQKAIKDRIDLYSAKGGQQLTEEEAVEEIIADAMAEAMDDPNFAAEVCEKDINLGQEILNSIRAALRSIRQIFANSDYKNDRFHNSLLSYLGILDEAEKMWLNALATAKQNKADGLIADWQDKANKQNSPRLSVGEDKWNNDEKLTKAKFNSFYSAHKLTYGRATKENIDDVVEKIKTDGFISTTAIANVVPASINDYVDPEKPNLTQSKYGAKEGDVVMFVPNKYVDLKNDIIKNGYKPRDYEIVEVERDYQPYYELYSKAYDDAHQTRFSVSEPVERVKDLIAVHNLKPEDIRNTFELGGFPMPSIAITKDSMGHDMYGDISLLFGSDTIDPKFFRSNQVFGGDAYTPTFPATQYKPNEDIVEKFRDIYYDNAKTLGYDAMRPFYELAEDAENALNRNGGEQGLIDRYKNDVRAMRTFLKINGKDVEDVVKRTEDTISETEQKLCQYFIDTLGEDALREFEGESIPHGKAMMEHRKNWTFEHSDEIKSAYRDFLNREFSFSDEEISNVLDNMNLFETMKLVRNALNYLNNGPTTVKEEVDRAATDKAIEDAAHELGYEEWIDGLLTGIEEKRGIRNDKEFFTRNGNRRSWDTLHDDITLENVVKAMRSELAAGGNGFLWKNPKGAAQKQYKSLDEIRADEDRLQQLPEEEYKSLEQAATQKLSDVLSDVVDNNPGRFMNSFGAVLDTGEYIAEILNETRDKDTMQRKLKKDYSLEVSDEQMDRIAEAIEEIANIPTGYFEAKPRRAVGFDEVKAAIIPATMDEDIKQGFADRNINMYEYDPDVEGDRTEKVNQAATEHDLRFSITDSEGTPLSEGQETFFANSKNRDSENRLKVMFHGTQDEFYEFDPTKAKNGTLGRAFYFTDSASHAGTYGDAYKYYLNLENPLEGDTHNITKDQLRRFVAKLAADEDYGIENYGADATIDSVTNSVWGGTDFQMLRDLNLSAVGDFAAALKVFNRVNGTDYDGIITPIETVAFYPEQIKSIDNLNPTLSKDTRYSITDSTGRELTDGQIAYFRDSQARDEEGRLVPVYHTTNSGGFTVFDPAFSDDHRSLFFTSNFAMSQSYGTNAFRNIMRSGTDTISFDDFIKMDGPSISTVVATRLIDMVDKDTGEVVWDGTENPVGTGSALRYWYKKDPKNLLASVGGEAMDREGFYRWMNEIADDGLFNYKNHGYYECYLNLKDPLIIDCQGANWDSIPPDGFDSMFISSDIEGETFYIDGTSVPWTLDEIRDAYGVGFAESIEEWLEYATEEDRTMGDNVYTWHGGPFNPEVEGYYPTPMNTREWCNEAEALGYDGVIFLDLKDNGPYGKGREEGNVYVAFNSNQVKDINNENPTENPDIRYSISDEDEAMSHMAHDYAYDTSYEALAYYEDLIAADASTETTYERAKNYIAKDVDEFYAGLTRYADGMKFDDPVLEEGRTRMARSKQDYFNSNVAKWNQNWLTDGEVLDIKSVKKAVKELVMANMQDSDTDRKYKTELVNKMLIDIRLAYFYAKQGRTDVADALLWHSAFRMVDGVGFYDDDGNYETYKKLRDYFKDARLRLGDEYWRDVDYAAFRKRNYGKLNLVKGETNIDKIFGDLYEEKEDGSLGGIAPEYFTPEAFEQNDHKFGSVPDTLLQIEDVLLDLEPYAKAYSSEYCAEWATDIASDLLDIMQNGKELQSIADKYTNKYEAKIKAMKARHAEAMLKVRQQRDEGIKREKAKLKEYKEQQREKKAHNKYFDSIQKTHKKLTERLLTNTADKNIPEQYKRELARLLAAFDLQTVGSKKYEARTGRQGQKTIKMAALKTALTNIENKSSEFHVADAITDIIDELLGKDAGIGNNRSIEGLTIDELSATELARIDKLLKALLHEFNTYRNVKIGAKRQQTEDIGKAQVDSALDHAKMFGAGRDYQNITGGIDRIINLDEVTPAYMFKHIDPEKSGLGLMFKELRRSFDKYVKNQEQLNKWMNEIVGKYHKRSKLPWKKYGAGELENWRSENYAQTFNLENGPVTLTPAQMMSLYCLSKRIQAYNHMTGAGIVVAPVSFNAKIMSDLKKKPNKALPVKLTDADIKQIVSQLTPDQVKVADELQQLMANRMAAWGNEASMNVLGIELFGEPDYFPIKSDKAALETDLNANEFVEAIRNFGFTKAVQPGARNAIMVDDIFNVVTEHCNNMNLYNAYSEAMNDFMKVYNYRDFRDDGSEYTVKQAIAHAYGSKATTFIMTFMRDLNGNVSGRASGIENLYNSLLGNAKKAAVFANLRVAAQQPTALTRAFAVIDPKYLKGVVMNEKAAEGIMNEMFEHCPIALWKSWGYYDINMGKSIEDIMMNNGRWLEDAATDLYGYLDNVTWSAIWQMVKAEMKDTHPDVKVGTDEYWELCNERMTEVVDFTQVVDSPFHRSHAMRDKGIFVKAATSFMAEPTLTFNMIRDGVIRSREAWKKGNKAEASRIAARTGAVTLLQAAAVAGAAALVDALRHKKPDKDDEDERLTHLWWVNAVENFHDEMKVWNKIYFVKDIASIFEGWENSNLALQGIQKFALGYRQLTGDPYARSSAAWYENVADGIGYMTGVPVKTVRTGLKNAMGLFGVSVSALDSIGETLDSVPKKKEDAEIDEGGMIGRLFSLVLSDDDKTLLDKYAKKKGYKRIDESEKSEGEKGTLTESELRESIKASMDAFDEKYNKLSEKAAEKAEGKTGNARNDALWDVLSEGYTKSVASGNMATIQRMREEFEKNGGDVAWFDAKITDAVKSEYKKTLYSTGDVVPGASTRQRLLHDYMTSHGVTDEEISDICYHSALAKDLKAAMRIGKEEYIMDELVPLVEAGLTRQDYEKLYQYRNYGANKYNGKYSDPKYTKTTGTFIWPTDGVITSHFGYRNSPTAGASSNHPAIDIGAPMGSTVVAADGGVVITAGWNGGYGNSVGIKHSNGMVTYYNHLSAWNVKVGDQVGQGQQIAQVGSTGISTGPHLDFKILDENGTPVDPEKYLGK